MNRNIFIITMVSLVGLGYLMQYLEVPAYGFILIVAGSIVVTVRRYYLKLKPIWGAPLKDIPKYFGKP